MWDMFWRDEDYLELLCLSSVVIHLKGEMYKHRMVLLHDRPSIVALTLGNMFITGTLKVGNIAQLGSKCFFLLVSEPSTQIK